MPARTGTRILDAPRSTTSSSRSKAMSSRSFSGWRPGVGKTYAMLTGSLRTSTSRPGRVDRICSNTRFQKRSAAMTKGLDQIPGSVATPPEAVAARKWILIAVLARQPHVVVVDELARANPTGFATSPIVIMMSRNCFLREADVFTTLNLHEHPRAKLTRWKSPARIKPAIDRARTLHFLDGAEIKLVDISIETFQKRLAFCDGLSDTNAGIVGIGFFLRGQPDDFTGDVRGGCVADHAAP